MSRQNLPILAMSHRLGAPGRIPDQRDVSCPRRKPEWILRVAQAPALKARPKRRDVDQANQTDS